MTKQFIDYYIFTQLLHNQQALFKVFEVLLLTKVVFVSELPQITSALLFDIASAACEAF